MTTGRFGCSRAGSHFSRIISRGFGGGGGNCSTITRRGGGCGAGT